MVSTTDYIHWTAPQSVIVPQVSYGATRPYAKYATNGVDTISIAFTDGHPRTDTQNGKTTSLYDIEYKTGVGWHTPAGTPLSLPVKIDDLQSKPDTIVYRDLGDHPAWVSDAALDPTTAYDDSSVAAGQTYYYVTTAVDGTGTESTYSNQVKAAIPTP